MDLQEFSAMYDCLCAECRREGIKVRRRQRGDKFYVTLTGQTNDHTMGRLRAIVKTYFPKAEGTSGSHFPPANVTMRVNP